MELKMKNRICKDCNKEFGPTGINQQRCKPCGVIAARKCDRECDKRRYEKLKGTTKSKRFRRHRLTESNFNEMFSAQGGKCAICGKHQTEFKKSLAIDHCHVNGHVRGLLCMKCNLMLGYADDKIEILLAAIDYLKLTKERNNEFRRSETN